MGSQHTLFTIGYGEKTIAQFITLLTANCIDILNDVRRWPEKTRVVYAQKWPLKNLCVYGLKMTYGHTLAFAPSETLLKRYAHGLAAVNGEARRQDYVTQSLDAQD